MNFALPSLRKKVLRQIFTIIFLFFCLGLSLLIIIQQSASIPKNIILKNNEITYEVVNMLDNWNLMNIDSSGQSLYSRDELQNNFQSSLDKLKNNEQKSRYFTTIEHIEEQWNKYHKKKQMLTKDGYKEMKNLLTGLILESQQNITQTLQKQIAFSKYTTILACLIFLIGLAVSIYFAEKLSSSVAQPLKKITQILQNKPKINEKLKFPAPLSLEFKVLTMEINELWKTLSELNSVNFKNLDSQRKEMEAIFSAMEDAAVVLDSQNHIQHYNKGFLEILAVEDVKLIDDQNWDDLSIMNDSYLNLRSLLRKDNYDEVLFTCIIKEEDKIYRVRKKIIQDSLFNKVGIIILLHDITKKLPPDKFKETLLLLKNQKNEIS